MEMMPLHRRRLANRLNTLDEDRTEVMDRLLDVLASLKGMVIKKNIVYKIDKRPGWSGDSSWQVWVVD